MTYQEFMENAANKIKEYLPETFGEFEASVQSYDKGGEMIQGLQIRNPMGEGMEICPIVPLRGFYEMLQRGNSLDQVMTELAEVYQNGLEKAEKISFTEGKTFQEIVLEHLYTAVYPLEIVQGWGNIPYLQIHDLAAVVKSKIGNEWNYTVTDDFLKEAGFSKDEIFEKAVQDHLQDREPRLFALLEVLGNTQAFIQDQTSNLLNPETAVPVPSFPELEMYVLTTRDRIFGAGVIADKTILSTAAERLGDNLILLPSSIHEWILLKEKNVGGDLETVRSIVKEVNQNVLKPADFLSDNVYRFDRKEKALDFYDGEIHTELEKEQEIKLGRPKF